MLNVYNGVVTTDDTGEATVTLPDYFEVLNGEYRYQPTVVGEFAQAIVAREVHQNRSTVATDKPRITVSWQVTGTRQNPWAVPNRIQVETDKTDDERGLYLHPRPGTSRTPLGCASRRLTALDGPTSWTATSRECAPCSPRSRTSGWSRPCRLSGKVGTSTRMRCEP